MNANVHFDDGTNSRQSFDNYSSLREASVVGADDDELLSLCERVFRSEDNVTWDYIKDWIKEKEAQVDDDGFSVAEKHARFRSAKRECALHIACKARPPLDIIKSLINLAPNSPSWPVDEGWLSLHFACFHGSSLEVLQELISRSPDSTCSTDGRGRTPVMFALKCNEKFPVHGAASILSLTQGGASSIKDVNGMLPLHYASAHGASDRVLDVLTDGYLPGVEKTDNLGRTPLHLAMVNSDKKTSPSTVKKLIGHYQEAINILDLQGELPIQLLSKGAKDKIGKETQDEKADEIREKKRNTQRCIEIYLAARPKRSFDLLRSLETLPDWLRKFAATTSHVRFMLNNRIVNRFPTFMMMAEFIFLVLSIISYRSFVFDEAINIAKEPEDEKINNKWWRLWLIVCIVWFSIRELMKLASFLYLGLFFNFISDLTNWVKIVKIILLFFSIYSDGFIDKQYKIIVMLSTVFLWTTVLLYLRATIIDFAVFVDGVKYVLVRLAPFLICLIIVLIAFSQMFYTIYMKDGCDCPITSNLNLTCPDNSTKSILDEPEFFPFCNFYDGFFRVYTMLVGEVDDAIFQEKRAAMLLYVLYAFLVVILLANVLIAIVGESYEYIKTQRAEEVFWSNRLYQLTEIDALVQLALFFVCSNKRDEGRPKGEAYDEEDEIIPHGPFADTWTSLCRFIGGDEDNMTSSSLEVALFLILRLIAVITIIVWVALGFCTFGLLWPPQISYFLFVAPNMRLSRSQQTADTSRSATEFRHLKDDVRAIKDLMRQEVVAEREKLESMRVGLLEEMKQIHHLLETLTEDFLGGGK